MNNHTIFMAILHIGVTVVVSVVLIRESYLLNSSL